jgi:hypothetical protein
MVNQLKEYPETYAKFNEFCLVDEDSTYFLTEVQTFLENEGFLFSFNRAVFNVIKQENVPMHSATFKMRFKTTSKVEDVKVMNAIDEYFMDKENLFISCFEILEY